MASSSLRSKPLSSTLVFLLGFAVIAALFPAISEAVPVFARKYDISCAACHTPLPRLNEFGEQFAGNNMRLPNWKDMTISGGDDMLALPNSVPLSLRTQAYIQQREATSIDIKTGTVYEGVDINTLTCTASYYFTRNVKRIIELNCDFTDTVPQTGAHCTGHLSSEHIALVGFDAAFQSTALKSLVQRPY